MTNTALSSLKTHLVRVRDPGHGAAFGTPAGGHHAGDDMSGGLWGGQLGRRGELRPSQTRVVGNVFRIAAWDTLSRYD